MCLSPYPGTPRVSAGLRRMSSPNRDLIDRLQTSASRTTPLSISYICPVSIEHVYPVSTEDIYPVSTKNITADRCKMLRQGWSRRLKSAACRSNRNFANSSGADRGRPGETGGVPGYGVKHPQADPPHPRAKARMTAVKQTPSNYVSLAPEKDSNHK